MTELVNVNGFFRNPEDADNPLWRGALTDAGALARRTKYLRTLADQIDAGDVVISAMRIDRGIARWATPDKPGKRAEASGKVLIMLAIDEVAIRDAALAVLATAPRIYPELLPGQSAPDSNDIGLMDDPGRKRSDEA